MNEQQRLFLVQARSDWHVFQLLRSEPRCHQLHYFQMCTEKLAKTYFWKSNSAGNIGHAAFVKFVRSMATNQRIAHKLGFKNAVRFREWIKDVSDLAYELKRLAPALALNGPNPEYPWPRENPQHTPVEYEFPAWRHMQTANGNSLRRMIDTALKNFEAVF